MLLGFGYLYKFVVFCFFFQKAENNRFKKIQLAKILQYYFFVFA